MTRDEAVSEVGWVAREAREVVAVMPDANAPAEVWAAWQQRWDEFATRKAALLEFIEADKGGVPMTTEGRTLRSSDIPRSAIGFSAFRILPNGEGRQYTACEMRRGWQGVERFLRICSAVGYVVPWVDSSKDVSYAVLDVINAEGDIVTDFNVPTAKAFRYVKQKLDLAVESSVCGGVS